MFMLCGRVFELIRVGLVRAGCPAELANAPGNRGPIGFPIVITKNQKKLGMVASTGYWPTGVIVAGVRTRAAMLNHSLTKGWAYVECGVDIKADDAIGSSELMEKLGALLMQRFYGQRGPVANQPYPYIIECYPFENYLIFSMAGSKYRQAFALDPIERKVTLQGPQVQVQEKFLDVAAVSEAMPRSDTGARYAFAPVRGNEQTFTTGGKNSELVTNMVRSMANIMEAVNMYLNYVRLCGASKWQPPTSNTVHKLNLSPEHKLLQARGIVAYSFAQWVGLALVDAAAGVKTVGTGEKVKHDDFAYVGDKNDPSTWHLPIHDANHAKNALARVNQTKGIPDVAKPGVLKKIHKAAKKHGVDVSAPSSQQSKWAHVHAGGPGSGPHTGGGSGEKFYKPGDKITVQTPGSKSPPNLARVEEHTKNRLHYYNERTGAGNSIAHSMVDTHVQEGHVRTKPAPKGEGLQKQTLKQRLLAPRPGEKHSSTPYVGQPI